VPKEAPKPDEPEKATIEGKAEEKKDEPKADDSK
jgi:hypothetical protein